MVVDGPGVRRRPRARRHTGHDGIEGLATKRVGSDGGSEGGSDGDPCPDAAELLAEVWNDEARSAIRSSLVANELAYVEATADRVEDGLDAYAARWTAERDAACRETEVTREQPRELMVARLDCLDDSQRQLASAVDVLSKADATVAENASPR